MVTCEKCGAIYKPTAQAPDCPECAASARKTAAPAVKPATSAARSAAPAARTSAAAAAKPAAPRPRPAAAAAAEQPVRRAAASPARAPAKAAPVHEPTPVHHHARADETLDKNTKIGLIAAGALAAIVCIVLFVVKSKHDKEAEDLAAFQAQVQTLYDKMKSLDINTEDGANQIIQLAKEKESVWKIHPLASQIQSLQGQAVSSLAANRDKNETIKTFEDLERQIKSAEALPADKIKNFKRSLDELEPRIPLGGPELVARFALAKTNADRAYATKLVDDAKAMADSDSGNPRLALQRYQTAEDELKGMLDAAFHEKNEEKKNFYTPLYKNVIEQSDRITEQVFTVEASEKLAWVDCLSGAKAGEWNPTATKGFAHRIDNGTLSLVGPDPSANAKALMVIGDKEQWRSFVVDMEFTLEQGNVELCFHLGKSPNVNTVYFDLQTEGDNKEQLLQPGKIYKLKISVLGSEFKARYADDTPRPTVLPIDWTKSRKGAIGILMPPGSRIKFTRFMVRELH
jgi:hypothetical protein